MRSGTYPCLLFIVAHLEHASRGLNFTNGTVEPNRSLLEQEGVHVAYLDSRSDMDAKAIDQAARP